MPVVMCFKSNWYSHWLETDYEDALSVSWDDSNLENMTHRYYRNVFRRETGHRIQFHSDAEENHCSSYHIQYHILLQKQPGYQSLHGAVISCAHPYVSPPTHVSRTHIHIRKNAHTHTNTHTHTHKHTRRHIHTHTYTHISTRLFEIRRLCVYLWLIESVRWRHFGLREVCSGKEPTACIRPSCRAYKSARGMGYILPTGLKNVCRCHASEEL